MQSTLRLLAASSLLAASVKAQVTASFPNGETNPDQPYLHEPGTPVNQSSVVRLATLNSVDDFCIWGPPEPGPDSLIGNVEPIVVTYCTKPRNGARLIPDGAIYSAHFIKTPMYVQIQGFFDGTQINIPYGDDGGELDPHGAENLGNPIGGNVTSNVSGQDVFYEEWMSFMSYNQFCMRVCTAETEDISAALMCEHELDVMGCQFVMPGDYTNMSFTSCDGDAAAPPGLYPQEDGSTSTFRQAWTYTGPGEPWTIGNTVTPAAPYSTPATSNCVTYDTIANGVALGQNAAVTGVASSASSIVSAATASATSVISSISGSSTARPGSSLASAAVSASSVASSLLASASADNTSAGVRSSSAPWSLIGGALVMGLAGAAALF